MPVHTTSFGKQLQYVVGLGGYYAKSNDAARSDSGVLLSGIHYGDGLVLEGGLRFNQAQPGSVVGPGQYVAATVGSDNTRAFVLRAERTNETYRLLPTGNETVDFFSSSVSLQWRERISRDGLLIVGLGQYQSPGYKRTGMDVGWRWSLR